MMSHEDSRCALSEGFAHFYAADTWNNHYETDCKYEYYKDELRNGDNTPAIDCELSDSNFPTNALGSVCGSWLQANHGTELDWLRTFWDMHTRANGPSFTSIVRWIDSAEPWQAHQCSSKLDDEAGDLGGQLGAAWDVYGSYNGVVQ